MSKLSDQGNTAPKVEGGGAVRGAGLSREDILAAAVTAFSRKGYRGTSLQDVAEVLCVTRQAIYYHYRNKHAILLAMFEQFFDKLSNAVAEARESESDPALRFERMLKAHIITVAKTPEMSAVFTKEFESLLEEARAAVRLRRRLYQEMFVHDYEAAQRVGRVRDLPPGATVSLLFGAANWTFRWYDEQRTGLTVEELAGLALELFGRGYEVS